MRLINNTLNVELLFPDDLLVQLKKYGIEHFPKEYGGFLIGKYSDDLKQLIISDIVLPKKYKSFPVLFERSTDGLKKLFEKIFADSKQYYVGEWHTHPNESSMYSQTDLKAMKQIANHETVSIENPVLLILSIANNSLIDFSIYVYNNERLYQYE